LGTHGVHGVVRVDKELVAIAKRPFVSLGHLSPGTATFGESRSLLLVKYRKGELEERVKAGDLAERGKVRLLAMMRITQPHPQLEVPFSRNSTQRPCYRRAASATSVHIEVHTAFILPKARARQSLPDAEHLRMRAKPRIPKDVLSEASASPRSE
jgi:hypothetical protein